MDTVDVMFYIFLMIGFIAGLLLRPWLDRLFRRWFKQLYVRVKTEESLAELTKLLQANSIHPLDTRPIPGGFRFRLANDQAWIEFAMKLSSLRASERFVFKVKKVATIPIEQVIGQLLLKSRVSESDPVRCIASLLTSLENDTLDQTIEIPFGRQDPLVPSMSSTMEAKNVNPYTYLREQINKLPADGHLNDVQIL